MAVEKLNDYVYVVTDTYGDSIAWRYDGAGELVLFPCTRTGARRTEPVTGNSDHIKVTKDDMKVLLEHYKETL